MQASIHYIFVYAFFSASSSRYSLSKSRALYRWLILFFATGSISAYLRNATAPLSAHLHT